MKLKQLFFSLSLSSLLLVTVGAANARDTDIYIVDPTGTSSEVRPNLMLILDTSGSMNEAVTATQTRIEVMKEALLGILDELNNVNVGLMRFTADRAGTPYGGPVVYPIKNIAEEVPNTGNVQAIVFDSADDAQEVGGVVTVNGNDLFLNQVGGTASYVGLRFQHVYIPQRSTILSAKLVVRADHSIASDNTDSVNLTITADLTGDAAPYSTTVNDISTRPQTAASATWNGSNSGNPWTDETFYESTDFKDVINEVVNRDVWCYGNSLALTIRPTNLAGPGTGRRKMHAYDRMDNTSDYVRSTSLVITYAPPAVASTCGATRHIRVGFSPDDAEERISNGNFDASGAQLELGRTDPAQANQAQYVGLRFRDVRIPVGATITNATLTFTTSAGDNSASTLTIRGERNTNAAQYSSGNKISNAGRPVTAASVTWNPPTTSAANQTITTPDIKDVIAEIVGLGGWASGNALAIRIEGNGRRRVRSFDGQAISAPILRIQYTAGAATAIFKKTVREQIKELLVPMRAVAQTPNIPTLYEAARYYRGEGVDYGMTRGNDGAPNARWAGVSHPDSYTGGSLSLPAGCTAADPNSVNCVNEAITGSPVYRSPIQYTCQTNHIVLMTDGIAQGNNAAGKINTMRGVPAATDCIGTNADEECGRELADFMFRVDQVTAGPAAAGMQNIRTHTIGFNVTDPFLQDLATRGGGLYKPVNTASELVTAFNSILNEVLSSPTSFVSPSLSINAFNRLYNRDEIYFTLFSPALEQAWPGNVKKFTLCANTGATGCAFGEVMDSNNVLAIDPATAKILTTSKSYWSTPVDGPTVKLGGAGEKVTANATRRVYTYTGTEDYPAAPVDLTAAAHAVTTTNASLTAAMLGVAATDRDALIHWMRGRDVDDEDGDCPGGAPATDACYTENRWSFGDALHSRPVTVTYGGNATTPVIKLIVGTNDGGVRMIDAASGQEDWFIYLPEFLATQQTLRLNGAGQHAATVDGSPTVRVIDNNNDGIITPGGAAPAGGDKVYLYVGMRRGGKDIYAFDITPPGVLTTASPVGTVAPKYMWRIKGGTGSFTSLGQTWSKPQLVNVLIKCDNASCDDGVGTTKDSMRKTVLMFAGGYDTNYDDVMPAGADSVGNAIYMVNPDTGARMWWAGGPGSGADLELARMTYSIPSDLALLDSNQDGAVDRVYVGDTRGQLWRIDLSNQIDPTAGSAGGRNGDSTGFVFADVGCTGGSRADHCAATAAVNKRGFFYAPDIAQVRDEDYSDTAVYDYVTIASGDREDPLDKKTPSATPVNNRVYAFRDFDVAVGSPATIPATPMNESALYNATVDNFADPSSGTYAANLPLLKAAKGWYINLNTGGWIGEKSLARPTIFAGVLYVTTFTPPSSSAVATPCAAPAEGTAKVYGLGLLTATGAVNAAGDRFEVVGGGIPSELVVIIREGGSSGLVGTSGGGKTVSVESKLPQSKTYWYQD